MMYTNYCVRAWPAHLTLCVPILYANDHIGPTIVGSYFEVINRGSSKYMCMIAAIS